MLKGISNFFIFAKKTGRVYFTIYSAPYIHKAKQYRLSFMKKNILKFRYSGSPQLVLLLRLLLVLILMVFTRLMLYFLNPSLFPGVTFSKLVYYSITGMRFDIVAILYANALYILLLILPFRFRRKRGFSIIADSVYYVTNIVLLIPNLADSAYFPFSLKRMTFDIFGYITTGDDTASMMPQFIRDYWYVFIVLLISVFILVFVSRRIVISNRYVMQKQVHYYLSQVLSMFVFAALSVLGVRGGIQLKPIGILSASQYAPSQETALVLNSAFTLMRSSDQKGINKLAYYTDENEMLALFNAQKNYSVSDSLGNKVPMIKKNVFIIILESFSKEHIGAINKLNHRKELSFTPFLDSLASRSLVFEGIANGKRSIEGIPAILASLPTWMNEDFITSQYAMNNFNSLASLLKKEGYNSSFFHGGKNGTMGFDAFCLSAGFDNYYGKNEYPDPDDYDGNWGIWDEPYLQYIARMLNSTPEPFLGAVFTLSSHHPYKVPVKYKNQFLKGKLEIQETIMYTDMALKNFFQSASKMSWFKNTVFVITADHTSEALLPFFQNRVGQYAVPIMFFQPDSDTTGQFSTIAQQTDIMPSVLDLLHYPSPFVAFGNSVFRSDEQHFGLNFLNGSYQLIQNGYSWQTDENISKVLYHFEKDSLLRYNLEPVKKKEVAEMDQLLKAVIQQYNNRMIENRLTVK